MIEDCQGYLQSSWHNTRALLQGLPPGKGLNIAHGAVVRHSLGKSAEVTAVRWLASDGSRGNLSYAELHRQSNQFANVLDRLGVEKGKIVFSLMGMRKAVLFTVIMGTLKHCNAFCPLFGSFGPEPVCQRLAQGGGEVLVTDRQQYRRKVAVRRNDLKQLKHILLTDSFSHDDETLSLPLLLQEASEDWEIPPTSPDDFALLHFTSGTTARPKGVVHVHEAAICHYTTGKLALDFRPGDIFWCTADPGWVTGISYGVIAPLLHNVTIVFDEGEFEAERWLRVIDEERVNVLYTSPTALRRLTRLPVSQGKARFPDLRTVHSVGEPLDQATMARAEQLFSAPVYDTWWQTETGSIMIANLPGQPARPGSMGRPLPGIDAAILDQKTGTEAAANVTGMLALRSGWPSMFRGYLDDMDRYRKCFMNCWYLTGDLAARSDDGYFWFKGRADDIIKSAGHLISPFEVESTLTRHPAVNEAAVYGVPDPIFGEIVTASVVLHDGFAGDAQLLRELLGFARKYLGTTMAPREIVFTDQLPKNRAGKIMRRLLKSGDTQHGEQL